MARALVAPILRARPRSISPRSFLCYGAVVSHMTVRKDLIIRCDGCREESVYSQSALRSSTLKSILENAGFVTESGGIAASNDHYCPDCNDREKTTYYVSDGRGEEYLGEIEAWGIVDARRVAWDTFNQENMVKRERAAAMP